MLCDESKIKTITFCRKQKYRPKTLHKIRIFQYTCFKIINFLLNIKFQTGKTIGGKPFTRLTSNYAQAKSIAFVTLYASEENSVRYNTKVSVSLVAYKSPGSPFAGRAEKRLKTSKIDGGDFANLNLDSRINFVVLSYTSPTVPIADRTVDEIIIRDNASKDILHKIKILLY